MVRAAAVEVSHGPPDLLMQPIANATLGFRRGKIRMAMDFCHDFNQSCRNNRPVTGVARGKGLNCFLHASLLLLRQHGR
jgi:hypothetical protein